MCVYLYCKLSIDQTSYSERDPECVREGLKGCEICRYNTSRAAFPEYQTHSIHLLQSTRCCSSTTTHTQAAKAGEVDCSISLLFRQTGPEVLLKSVKCQNIHRELTLFETHKLLMPDLFRKECT